METPLQERWNVSNRLAVECRDTVLLPELRHKTPDVSVAVSVGFRALTPLILTVVSHYCSRTVIMSDCH